MTPSWIDWHNSLVLSVLKILAAETSGGHHLLGFRGVRFRPVRRDITAGSRRDPHHRFSIRADGRAVLVLGRDLSGYVQAGSDVDFHGDAASGQLLCRHSVGRHFLCPGGDDQSVAGAFRSVVRGELDGVITWLQSWRGKKPARIGGAFVGDLAGGIGDQDFK